MLFAHPGYFRFYGVLGWCKSGLDNILDRKEQELLLLTVYFCSTNE